jgi:hypothetical protein
MATETVSRAALADLIDRAAARLERYGWIQKERYSQDQINFGVPLWQCSACASGAIDSAAMVDADGREVDGPDLGMVATEVFGPWLVANRGAADMGYPDSTVFEWNDAEGRTAAEVVLALRGCAADLRGAS